MSKPSKWSLPGEKFKISEETANAQVMELLTKYKIDINDYPDGDSRASFEMILNKLSKQYRREKLENRKSDKGFQVVLHLENNKGDIAFDEPKGDKKQAMDGFDKNDNVQRQHALMGALCGLGSDAIKALDPLDLSAVECLAGVFFSV